KGRLWDASRCQLSDAAGHPVDAQFIAWSQWPDHSIKWLIVDFEATTGQTRQYVLKYGVAPVKPKTAVAVRKQGNNLLVEGLRARMSLPAGKLFGPVWADRNGDGKASDAEQVLPGADLVLTDARGKRYQAGPPDQTLVLEAGPMHAMVRRTGWLVAQDGTKFFRYRVLFHLWRDLPDIKLEVSLDNANVQQDMSLLSSFALVLPVTGRQLVLADGTAKSLASKPLTLLQDYDNRYLLDGSKAGTRYAGSVEVLDGGGPVLAACVRDFWKLWPKGFTATSSSLSLDLLPALPPQAYSSEEDRKIVDRLYFWCDSGKYKLRQGVRLTTEVFLDLAPPKTAQALQTKTRRVNEPLFAAATPEYYCSSGAFGRLYPRDKKTFPRYEENVDWSFGDLLRRQKTQREYGFMNYGDWYGERHWNWGNLEYDTSWALALLFAHTGRLDRLWRAEAAVRHNTDVDTIHYNKDPRKVGKLYCHCMGHTGGYFPSDFKNMGIFNRGAYNYGHTWDQGQLVNAALFGSYRFRENGELIASEIVRTITPYCPFYARDAGWTEIAMCAAYEQTGNPWYLQGARLMADRMLQRQDPLTGAMGSHFLDPAECKHHPRHYGPKPFMTGIMLRGLRMYDQIEPRDDVKRAIVRCADWMWNEAWVARDHGFWYSACTTFTSRGGIWTFNLVGDGLAYACLVDKDHFARRKNLLIEACAAHLYDGGRSGFGKGFTQETCCMLYALEWMRELGITDVKPLPKKEARATVSVRSALVLGPGEKRVMRPFVRNPRSKPVRVEVTVRQAPGWLQVLPPAARAIGPGDESEIALQLRCAPGTKPGTEGLLRLRFRLSGLSDTREVKVLVGGEEDLGREVGIITGPKDHLAPALAAVGLKATGINEADWSHLRPLRALVVGDEALYYNFASLREHLVDLQRFVYAGGLLVVGQINDDRWDPGLLPWDLYLDEPETAAGKVLVPDHPLFAGLNPAQLAGIVSYDTIVHAASEWKVLMTDTAGRPAILEGTFGKGKVLVIEPSFDRPVVEPTDPYADRADACRALMQRLKDYIVGP
ncbi:MAG: hypothetical protein J7M26_02240, partial [Armatimonadetes bacterium]|nr:hypothetical protein [Armatimonadota bacterium]